MSSAKNDVMKLIAKKQKKNQEYKSKAAQRIGANGIVMQFIDAMEKIAKESKNSMDFHTGLDRESNLLHDNLKAIDRGVSLEIIWADNPDESWKNLNVDGVRITWSDYYINLNPQKSKDLYVDLGSLLLEGHLTS